MRWDAGVELYYVRHRWYDPYLGRFLTRDPIGAFGDLLNLGNPYAFVGNNPWSYVDPWGLEGQCAAEVEDWGNKGGRNMAAAGWSDLFFSLLGAGGWQEQAQTDGAMTAGLLRNRQLGEDASTAAHRFHEGADAASEFLAKETLLTAVTGAALGVARHGGKALKRAGGNVKQKVSTWLSGSSRKARNAGSPSTADSTRVMPARAKELCVAPGIGRANPFGNLGRASEFGIMPYRELVRAKIGASDLHAHHLIERRFSVIMGEKQADMLSIALTRTEHQRFTNAWRKAFPYGAQQPSRNELLDEAARIYAEYPAILEALGL